MIQTVTLEKYHSLRQCWNLALKMYWKDLNSRQFLSCTSSQASEFSFQKCPKMLLPSLTIKPEDIIFGFQFCFSYGFAVFFQIQFTFHSTFAFLGDQSVCTLYKCRFAHPSLFFQFWKAHYNMRNQFFTEPVVTEAHISAD